MQEDDAKNMWVCSLFSCCIPNCDVIPPILVLSQDTLSILNNLLNFVLRLPTRTIEKRLIFAIVSKLHSSLSANVSNHSKDWFGDLYRKIDQVTK